MPLAIQNDPNPLRTDADGVIRVGPTRVTLDIVVNPFLDGASAEAIVDQYPTLNLRDVYSVIGYYLGHRAEVDEYLREQKKEAIKVREEVERRFPPYGIRERLLARRQTGR